MLKKALIISTLAVSSFLFTSISFAFKPTTVHCPPKRLIEESVDKVQYEISPASKWQEYTVMSKTPAFESDGHAWIIITRVHANDSNDALSHAKKNMRDVLENFNDFAEMKDDAYLSCMYVGSKGIIGASTIP